MSRLGIFRRSDYGPEVFGLPGTWDDYDKRPRKLSKAKYPAIDDDLWEKLCDVAVDSGMAGIFPSGAGVPDMDSNAYSSFINELSWCEKTVPYITSRGVCSNSGFGDGCYPCWTIRGRGGAINALEIVFIAMDDEGDSIE